MTEQHVQIVDSESKNPAVLWNPVVGSETLRLLDASDLDEDGDKLVRTQSVEVLSRCAGPMTSQKRTGLVVGYVQSGKTLSFTTVISLARDNGIPLIILLAGTKQNLHEQTSNRLSNDLQVERAGGLSPWALLENPLAGQASTVAQYIQSMTDQGVPDQFRRAVVITVMKNPARLRRVTQLVRDLAQYGVDVASTPVLVVDDEADQAGLNAAVQEDEKEATATYQAIVDLRTSLGSHTYLMYTATPQAPLLINLADVLSPDFVYVLTPGAGYTGGQYFFKDHEKTFVRRLSTSAVTTALTSPSEPPEELKKALASYLLVLAQRGGGPMSMLVHPSHTTDLHETYGGFVNSLCASWKALLQDPGADRDELVAGYLKPAHEDLVAGGVDMQPLDGLLSSVPFWIGSTQVRVVNSGTPADSDIKWNAAPSWILIGGNKLDRGFTVEGLCTTFMPRRIGAGQVDSVQQRARFFGYKASYGLMCRAWINGATAGVFEHYVEHEQVLRNELRGVADEGIDLHTWKRRMLLESAYKPTRKAVVDIPYFHDRIKGDSWLSLTRYVHPGSKSLEVVTNLLNARGPFPEDERDPRGTQNERGLVPISDVLELLADWDGAPADMALVNQAALLLGARLDADPWLEAEIYLMDGFAVRERSPDKDSGVITLQQGRNPKGGYAGDATFFTDGITALQVHKLLVKASSGPVEMVGLNLRVPQSLSGAFLLQA
jgi:hypothetical protein